MPILCSRCCTWNRIPNRLRPDAFAHVCVEVRCAVCGVSRGEHRAHGCRRLVYRCPSCEDRLCADVKRDDGWAAEPFAGGNRACWRCRLDEARWERRREEERIRERLNKADADYQAFRQTAEGQAWARAQERKYQLQCVRTGATTLRELRYLLAHPGQLRLRQWEYERERTSPG